MVTKRVQVRIATKKATCKNCGTEYNQGDVAMMAYCETCGLPFKQENIELGLHHTIVDETGNSTAKDDAIIQFGDRIKIKKYKIDQFQGSKKRISSRNGSYLKEFSMKASWVRIA